MTAANGKLDRGAPRHSHLFNFVYIIDIPVNLGFQALPVGAVQRRVSGVFFCEVGNEKAQNHAST